MQFSFDNREVPKLAEKSLNSRKVCHIFAHPHHRRAPYFSVARHSATSTRRPTGSMRMKASGRTPGKNRKVPNRPLEKICRGPMPIADYSNLPNARPASCSNHDWTVVHGPTRLESPTHALGMTYRHVRCQNSNKCIFCEEYRHTRYRPPGRVTVVRYQSRTRAISRMPGRRDAKTAILRSRAVPRVWNCPCKLPESDTDRGREIWRPR